MSRRPVNGPGRGPAPGPKSSRYSANPSPGGRRPAKDGAGAKPAPKSTFGRKAEGGNGEPRRFGRDAGPKWAASKGKPDERKPEESKPAGRKPSGRKAAASVDLEAIVARLNEQEAALQKMALRIEDQERLIEALLSDRSRENAR